MMTFLTARAIFINFRTIMHQAYKKTDIENVKIRYFTSDLSVFSYLKCTM